MALFWAVIKSYSDSLLSFPFLAISLSSICNLLSLRQEQFHWCFPICPSDISVMLFFLVAVRSLYSFRYILWVSKFLHLLIYSISESSHPFNFSHSICLWHTSGIRSCASWYSLFYGLCVWVPSSILRKIKSILFRRLLGYLFLRFFFTEFCFKRVFFFVILK